MMKKGRRIEVSGTALGKEKKSGEERKGELLPLCLEAGVAWSIWLMSQVYPGSRDSTCPGNAGYSPIFVSLDLPYNPCLPPGTIKHNYGDVLLLTHSLFGNSSLLLQGEKAPGRATMG